MFPAWNIWKISNPNHAPILEAIWTAWNHFLCVIFFIENKDEFYELWWYSEERYLVSWLWIRLDLGNSILWIVWTPLILWIPWFRYRPRWHTALARWHTPRPPSRDVITACLGKVYALWVAHFIFSYFNWIRILRGFHSIYRLRISYFVKQVYFNVFFCCCKNFCPSSESNHCLLNYESTSLTEL